ncbi:amidohydrolase family protein [Citreimonas sp.]|uniref:amidohydrolase family protein n=1 Tax=Citreimonas sp. TaxID=3036715 RepID=UPI004059AE61
MTEAARSPMPEPPAGLTDIHVHLGPSDTGELYYPHLTPDEWLEMAEASGIMRAVAFAPTNHAGYAQANAELARVAAGSGGRIRAFARLSGPEMPLDEAPGWLWRRAVKRRLRPPDPGLAPEALETFAGVKLLPQLDGVPGTRHFEAIADLRLPVLCHSGRMVPPRWIARRILPRTTGPVIVAHLGQFPDAADLAAEAFALARSDPRVWLDTSGIWRRDQLRHPDMPWDRLVFGSDCPLTHPRVAWDQVARALPDPGLAARIGRDAAEEILS